jgi:septal ring factor EnvC (AmiA/AmiB activator)
MDNIWTVLVTLAGTLTGASAFRYYEKRAAKKEEDDRFVFNDCRSRISKLEALLEKSSQEKDELRAQILTLTAEVAKLQTEIKYLIDGKGKSI